MRNTLALVGREHGLIPTFSLESRRIVDGKAAVIADLDALAMIHVFMREVAPLARQINAQNPTWSTALRSAITFVGAYRPSIVSGYTIVSNLQ